MSIPVSHRVSIAVAFALLVSGGCLVPVSAGQESGAPLSTAGVNPKFDWGDFQPGNSRRAGGSPVMPPVPGRSQTVLRGGVQVQRSPALTAPPAASYSPASPDRVAAGATPPATEYVGTPAKVTLHGIISHAGAGAGGDSTLDQFFSSSLGEAQTGESATTASHFRANFRKIADRGKGFLNFVFDYRAFGPSIEAADLILDEHGKGKGADAGSFYKQHERDEKHLQTVAGIMQLGMGLGMPGTARGQRLTDSSLTSLRNLIGDKQTDEIFATLKQCSKTLHFPQSLSNQDLWDMKEREGKIKQIIQSAINSDPVVQELRTDLHKYNHHSKFAQHATGVLQTALSMAAFTPTIAAPAAETTYFMLMMATGGPEQDKLLRELYISKKLESRMQVINEKAHMAIDTYHMAVLSENPVLLACTQSMVRQMSGEETVREVFGGAEVAQSPLGAPGHAIGHPPVYFSAPAGSGLDTPVIEEASRKRKCEREGKPAA